MTDDLNAFVAEVVSVTGDNTLISKLGNLETRKQSLLRLLKKTGEFEDHEKLLRYAEKRIVEHEVVYRKSVLISVARHSLLKRFMHYHSKTKRLGRSLHYWDFADGMADLRQVQLDLKSNAAAKQQQEKWLSHQDIKLPNQRRHQPMDQVILLANKVQFQNISKTVAAIHRIHRRYWRRRLLRNLLEALKFLILSLGFLTLLFGYIKGLLPAYIGLLVGVTWWLFNHYWLSSKVKAWRVNWLRHNLEKRIDDLIFSRFWMHLQTALTKTIFQNAMEDYRDMIRSRALQQTTESLDYSI